MTKFATASRTSATHLMEFAHTVAVKVGLELIAKSPVKMECMVLTAEMNVGNALEAMYVIVSMENVR